MSTYPLRPKVLFASSSLKLLAICLTISPETSLFHRCSCRQQEPHSPLYFTHRTRCSNCLRLACRKLPRSRVVTGDRYRHGWTRSIESGWGWARVQGRTVRGTRIRRTRMTIIVTRWRIRKKKSLFTRILLCSDEGAGVEHRGTRTSDHWTAGKSDGLSPRDSRARDKERVAARWRKRKPKERRGRSRRIRCRGGAAVELSVAIKVRPARETPPLKPPIQNEWRKTDAEIRGRPDRLVVNVTARASA